MKPLAVPILIGFVIQGIILSWINKLERKCECSADWRRDYIKYFSIAMIVFSAARLIVPDQTEFMPVMLTVGLAGLVNVVSILSYIPDLKKKQCDCAIENDWRDNFIFWWILISLILTTLVSGGATAFMLTRK
jgi:hypothetical protein